MVLDWMMFGDIISFVVESFFPMDVKLALALTIAEPVKTHVHGFGAFLLDVVVHDASGDFVVELNRSGTLAMSEFFQCGAHGDEVLAVEEASTGFGFLCRGHDGVDDFAEDVDGAIRGGFGVGCFYGKRGFVAEVMEASGARACLGFAQVGGVGVCPEMHLTGDVFDGGIRMGGGVVEEVVDFLFQCSEG